MKKIQVFIIDDHQLIIDGVKAMFQQDENIVFVGSSNDGLDAKQQLESLNDQIDLIITDISLPNLSGIEICKFIKTSFIDKKVLMMSMYKSSAIITEALRVEADGYILKTTCFEDFRLAIYRVMDGSSFFSESIYPIIHKELFNDSFNSDFLLPLTPREVEVLLLIIQEYTSTEIAEKLFISKKTVDNHRQHLLSKTNSKSTIGLLKFAMKAGFIVD